MKVKVNLSNQTLEYMDTQPYIQGTDTRNKLSVYIEHSTIPQTEGAFNIMIAYALQNGRTTIKMANTGATQETIDDVLYDVFYFTAPSVLTSIAGNFVATIILKVNTNLYKVNVLNTVLNSVEFETFESALEETEATILENLENMAEDITYLQGQVVGVLHNTDIVDNDTSNDPTKVLSARMGKVLAERIGATTSGLVSATYNESTGVLTLTYENDDTYEMKIGLSTTDKSNMADDVENTILADLFETFSTVKSYSTGDFVNYENNIYEFVSDKSSGAWDSTKVVVANLNDYMEEVNTSLANMTETIEGLGQLQPSGTDTSTNILAFAEDKGIYIATDNGHWYYWNGTQYADGGVYMSAPLDTVLSLVSTNGVENKVIGKDLCNRDDYIGLLGTTKFSISSGGYHSSSNDRMLVDIKQGEEYYITITATNGVNAGTQIFEVGLDGVSTANNTVSITTTSSRLKVIAQKDIQLIGVFINTVSSNTDIKILIEKENCYRSYLDKDAFYVNNTIVDKNNNLVTLKYYSTDYITCGKNLFNKNLITTGKYISYSNGAIYDNQYFWLSDYVLLDINQEYITVSPTNGYQLCFFDKDLNYISGSYYGDGTSGHIAIPSNAKYIRFSDDLTRLNVFQIEYGQTTTTYENYYLKLKYSTASNAREKLYVNNVTNLISLFKYAYDNGNCDIYISKGTYDISSVSSITSVFNYYGLRIGKNNNYYFEEGSKIVCNYTGSDDDILKNFSVFTSLAGDGSFELHNCKIECSKIRYAVHDENGGTNANAYTHKFVNCEFVYDNSTNPYVANYNMVLGGGLGTYALIILENCIFKNMMANAVDVSYHGNYESTMTSGIQKVVVTGCYFSYRFQMANPNYETTNKTFIYANNSSKVAVRVEDTTKVDSYIYNNEIRN